MSPETRGFTKSEGEPKLLTHLLRLGRGVGGWFGRIDPGGGRKLRRTRRLADEALGVSRVSSGEHLGAGVVGSLSLAVVDDLGGHEADA